MGDELAPLPPEDESPRVLLDDALSILEAQTGLQLTPAQLEYALLAAGADEDAVLYALLRERADDYARDLGRVYGVEDPQPVPAVTTTTWTARAGREGLLTAGTTLVVDAQQGLVAFEVISETVVAAGTSVTGILVQAVEEWAGIQANQATGPVELDQAPAWVQSVTVEEPAAGGRDAATDTEQLELVKRAARSQHVAPVNDEDLELRVQDIPVVRRALILDNYDVDTGQSGVEGVCTVVPIDELGEQIVGAAIVAQITDLVSGGARRILNGQIKLGVPAYTTIAVDLTVIPVDGYDLTTLDDAVRQAVLDALHPSTFAQPTFEQRPRWKLRRNVRTYEVAAQADGVLGVDEISQLTFTVTLGPGSVQPSGHVLLAGYAPLPRPGAVTVTFTAPN